MRFAMFSMGIAGLLIAATATLAEAKTRKADDATHTGTFVATTAGKMTMLGADGKEHTHSVAKDAKVTIDGKSGALDGLKKGMKITVTTDKKGMVTAIRTADGKTNSTKPVAPAKPATSQPSSVAK